MCETWGWGWASLACSRYVGGVHGGRRFRLVGGGQCPYMQRKPGLRVGQLGHHKVDRSNQDLGSHFFVCICVHSDYLLSLPNK